MNKLEVNQVGGFPMTTRILDEIQKAHAVFNSLGGLAGNFTIIAGCAIVGSTVSDGFVFINGEVFDFKGGLAQSKVMIREDLENLTFQNGNANPVIKTRYVTFGTGVGAFNWADFKRPIETKEISNLIQRIADLEARPLVGNIPIGLIAIWGQAANLIPVGWAEYTELRGKVAIGLDPDDLQLAVLGSSGGAKNKKLSINEIPEHDHDYEKYRLDQEVSTSGDGVRSLNKNNISDVFKTSKMGGGQAFSIMNPYRVVQYIKYVG